MGGPSVKEFLFPAFFIIGVRIGGFLVRNGSSGYRTWSVDVPCGRYSSDSIAFFADRGIHAVFLPHPSMHGIP